ncbi:MAG: tRNA (adenosine(37)-N6)-threonylcarbamoyltransferase complex ATPase subunit type 1 TsaE [Planctomycetia bacterium]|nr:tRNA (adenosine(37)-N6)-threonylcarbamoyltransferase complex ATPase subunit type 1 TsaE [Planctomycetia bacterium]
MAEFIHRSFDEAATARLGAALAELLSAGSVVALIGTLGAGKTRLVQGIAVALGVDPGDVVSPTYVILHEYRGRRRVFHFDAYRIKDDDEFLELGPDEYFESDGVTLVEWADRVERCLPRERLEIRIDATGAESREFRIAAIGQKYVAVVDGLNRFGWEKK